MLPASSIVGAFYHKL